MAQMKQKITGCFWKQQHAMAACQLAGGLQPMAAAGGNPPVPPEMGLGRIKDTLK